ncbi:MAG: hypothetical protein WB538_03865 [Candidatus Sulfotelmatobacter sp.]
MNNDMLNAAVASIEETREANCRNADNHDLGHRRHFPIGDVPEVNGLWAQEVEDFVPTTGELLVIAEHWASVAIERTYVGWANANVSISTKDWRRIYFAWRRVYRIRALLGDVIDGVIDDQVKKFHNEEHDQDGAQWDPENWRTFFRLIDRESQKKHLAPVQHFFHPPSEEGRKM